MQSSGDDNNPPVPKVDPEAPVWLACRATPDCPGKQSKVVTKFVTQEGGRSIRYRCLTCNKPFHITC